MGRPPIFDRAMTATERQRRRRKHAPKISRAEREAAALEKAVDEFSEQFRDTKRNAEKKL